MEKIVIDENLIKKAKANDEDAMVEISYKFKPKIEELSFKYFLAGGDRDDIVQEAMIACIGAVKSYDFCKNDNFYAFVLNCIELRIKSAVKKSLRKKHIPLNTSLSIEEQSELASADIYSNPEEKYISSESVKHINEELRKLLSPYEQDVVALLRGGMKTGEIAKLLKKDPKSVDNAIQRIRKKAYKWFYMGEL